MGEAPKTFSRAEVKEHGDQKSAWVIIHDRVYDVTKFLVEHPGGEDILLDQAGKDATEDFEDQGHSEDAHEIMKEYLIGELNAGEKTGKK